MNISSIPAIRPPSPVDGATPAAASGAGFSSVFESAIQTVGSLKKHSETSVEQFLSGEGEDLHRVILAGQRAELAFDLFVQVRNKVVQAYQEVMRMQV